MPAPARQARERVRRCYGEDLAILRADSRRAGHLTKCRGRIAAPWSKPTRADRPAVVSQAIEFSRPDRPLRPDRGCQAGEQPGSGGWRRTALLPARPVALRLKPLQRPLKLTGNAWVKAPDREAVVLRRQIAPRWLRRTRLTRSWRVNATPLTTSGCVEVSCSFARERLTEPQPVPAPREIARATAREAVTAFACMPRSCQPSVPFATIRADM